MSSTNESYPHDTYHDMVSSPDDESQAHPMQDDSGTIHDPLAETQVPVTIDDAAIAAAAEERRAIRPAYKLSVKLIDTYKNINKIYYENKAKRQKEKQASETISSSSASHGRTGVNNEGYDDNNYNYILREGGDGELFNNRYVFKYKIGSVRELSLPSYLIDSCLNSIGLLRTSDLRVRSAHEGRRRDQDYQVEATLPDTSADRDPAFESGQGAASGRGRKRSRFQLHHVRGYLHAS
jgi:hypothetical protein